MSIPSGLPGSVSVGVRLTFPNELIVSRNTLGPEKATRTCKTANARELLAESVRDDRPQTTHGMSGQSRFTDLSLNWFWSWAVKYEKQSCHVSRCPLPNKTTTNEICGSANWVIGVKDPSAFRCFSSFWQIRRAASRTRSFCAPNNTNYFECNGLWITSRWEKDTLPLLTIAFSGQTTRATATITFPENVRGLLFRVLRDDRDGQFRWVNGPGGGDFGHRGLPHHIR